MNAESFNDFFSPLGKEYCTYFYVLSVLGFVIFWVLLISGLYMGISQKKGSSFYFKIIMMSLSYAIIYFQNRLLHSMCVR